MVTPPKGRRLVTFLCCGGFITILLGGLYFLGYGEDDLSNWLKFFLDQLLTEGDISG